MLAVEQDVAFNPVDISPFRSQTEMADSDRAPDLIQQARAASGREFGQGGSHARLHHRMLRCRVVQSN